MSGSAPGRSGLGDIDAGKTGAGRHGIKAAGMERGALHEAAEGEPETHEEAVRADRAGGVVRAGRREPAAAGGAENRGQGGRERALVEPDQPEEGLRGEARESRGQGGTLRHGAG